MSDSTCVNWEVWSDTGGTGVSGGTGGRGREFWKKEDSTSDSIYYESGNIDIGGSGGPAKLNIWQGGIHFDPNPGIYKTHGWVTTMQVGEGVGFGDSLRLHSDGKLYKANATNIPQEIVFCLSIEVASSDNYIKVLLEGFINNPAWGFTGGKPLYLGTSDGEVSEIRPVSNIQVLGIAKPGGIILFNPAFGGIGGGAGGARYSTTLLTGATGYSGTHGLGEEPIIQCFNSSWTVIEPEEIRVSSSDFLVDFDTDITNCYVICIA